jgi:putative nucleotidyltransferase with HDIG domain
MIETSASFRHGSRAAGEAISLSEVLSALSYALDLTEGAVRGHALRSCLLGMRIADEIGIGSVWKNSLYYALLLKDVAGSTFGGGVDGAAVSLRCDRSASIMRKLGMGELAAEAVRCVDERWNGGGIPDRLRGENIPLLARICAVARHLDMVSTDHGARNAMATLIERSGTWFDPEMVRSAQSLDARGVLWVSCFSGDGEEEVRRAVLDLDPGGKQYLEAAEIDRVCEAFADVVDAKSHFTFSHSMGVADAAFGIAESFGLPAGRVQVVRRAALLHDIGKLSVPNAILDKVGPLTAKEWRKVRQHPGYTRRILERVGLFREIAMIAGEHHEKLDGSGYPNRLMGRDLSLEARIVAVADVYGALSEDRPYRAGLEFDRIVPIMKSLAPRKLDRDCVEALVDVVCGQKKAYSSAMQPVGAPMMYAAV